MCKNILKITTFVLLAAMFIACNPAPTAKVTKGVKPIADTEVAIIEMEQPVYGKFTLELFSNIAPEMV